MVLGIDLQESATVVKNWATGKNLTYTMLLDPSLTVWAQYGRGYIPHNVVIDPENIVRYTNYGYNETAIKNVIETYLPSGVKDQPDASTPTTHGLFRNYPNPFQNDTRFYITIPVQETFSISIYNVSGQLVRRFENVQLLENQRTLQWDRTDCRGVEIPKGIYFAVLRSPHFRKIIKLVAW